MLKLEEKELAGLEGRYPGIVDEILKFEQQELPPCIYCNSNGTAAVQIGTIARTIQIAAATTKFILIANGPKPGSYFCQGCGKFFG